jgi:hypothetical protein
MIEYIKASGITRAYNFCWNPGRFGVLKDDGTYRLLWDVLTSSNDTTLDTTVPDTTEPTYETTQDTTLDTTAPNITGLSNDTTQTNSKIWTWGADEPATFRYLIDDKPDSIPAGDYSNTTTATQSGVNGTYYIHVQVKDTAGNESEIVTVSAVLVSVPDTTTPDTTEPASITTQDTTIDTTTPDTTTPATTIPATTTPDTTTPATTTPGTTTPGTTEQSNNTAQTNPSTSVSVNTNNGGTYTSQTTPQESNPVKAFTTRFYKLCLSRDPDGAGLNGWVNGLKTGAITGAKVAYGFVFSDEFIKRNVSNEEYLTILYRAFFNREPDSGGYNGWLASLTAGKPRKWVLAGFINSQEFKNLCAVYGIKPGSL